MISRIHRPNAVAAVLLSAFALCAVGTADATDAPLGADAGMMTADQGLAKSDAEFFQKAAMGGMTEIAAAKIAVAKSSDPQIKSFAQRMIKDHGKADAKLMALAKSKDVTLPAALDADHQAKLDDLQKASGKDFDDEYSDMMSSDHEDAVELFSDTARSSKDADIKMFAGKTLPTLKAHQALARQMDADH